MAKSTSSKKKTTTSSKKKASAAKKKSDSKKKSSTKKDVGKNNDKPAPKASAAEMRKEAKKLEDAIEAELLRDAVLSARVALEDLRADTHARPFERRRGIRLREKALKVERAFNRLRALRKGDLLPERHPDD